MSHFSNNTVYVMDAGGKSLLPTTSARARLLLRKEKADVYSVIPYTIKLKRAINNPVGEFKVGIDDGAKMVGIAVEGNGKIVFAANVELRQDVSRKMSQRRAYRQTRRSRKVRHRETRFSNRGKTGWIPPTIRYKKDVIIRVVNDLKKRLNITSAVIEQGQFDVSSMSAGYQLTGREYQKSEYEGNNWRQKVLWRDHYKCQHCSSTENLQAHHIVYRSKGGTNRVENGLTLCKECHASLHRGEWVLSAKKVKFFKYPTHTQQGKWYIYGKLLDIFEDVKICYGWMTAKSRRLLDMAKDHHYDASAMLGCGNYQTVIYNIKPRRTKTWEDNPAKKCTEKNGFRHYDIVKASHRTQGIVIGSIKSLKKTCITLRTAFDNDFGVSYRKSVLLQRPKGLIYTFGH